MVFGSVLGPDRCRVEQALAEAVRGTVVLQTTKVRSLPDFRNDSLMWSFLVSEERLQNIVV